MKDRAPLHSCPRLAEAFTVFGKRWSAAIIDLLLQRPARFGEIARALPDLSQRVLTERLRELEHTGVLARRVDTGSPISVTYSLTPCGEKLRPAMDAMREWADELPSSPEAPPPPVAAGPAPARG